MKTAKPLPPRRADEATSALSKDDLLLKLELRSDPKLLCVVRAAIERLAEVAGFSPAECRSLTIAVDEALANVIRHAYCGRADQPIRLSCRAVHRQDAGGTLRGVQISLLDRGPAIDPAKLCGRPLGEVKPGGLGLHFIRQSMDTVEFRRLRGANELRLVKFLRR